eukprot:TRINITY_DN37809_c0_g1_i1.p2 TRINITY_DN37809_c0_g1~~TRINITY_DN37809_c0_g1_i1.p2  ORF type:complete len:147 (+),score=9.47 TRINITY_DN37809_c0_g1_i1:111-551(+)
MAAYQAQAGAVPCTLVEQLTGRAYHVSLAPGLTIRQVCSRFAECVAQGMGLRGARGRFRCEHQHAFVDQAQTVRDVQTFGTPDADGRYRLQISFADDDTPDRDPRQDVLQPDDIQPFFSVAPGPQRGGAGLQPPPRKSKNGGCLCC